MEIIFNALIEKLSLDPEKIIKARLKLAEKYFREAQDYLGRGDSVQASEKMYKVVEECIKALAQLYNLPEYKKAIKESRWWT